MSCFLEKQWSLTVTAEMSIVKATQPDLRYKQTRVFKNNIEFNAMEGKERSTTDAFMEQQTVMPCTCSTEMLNQAGFSVGSSTTSDSRSCNQHQETDALWRLDTENSIKLHKVSDIE